MLAVLLQLVFMQGLSLVDMAKPALAESATSLAPSTTQGVLLFAIAGGYSVGTLSGGQMAELGGLASLPAFVAGLAAGAFVLAMIWNRFLRKTG